MKTLYIFLTNSICYNICPALLKYSFILHELQILFKQTTFAHHFPSNANVFVTNNKDQESQRTIKNPESVLNL